jgi:hypothetical protein
MSADRLRMAGPPRQLCRQSVAAPPPPPPDGREDKTNDNKSRRRLNHMLALQPGAPVESEARKELVSRAPASFATNEQNGPTNLEWPRRLAGVRPLAAGRREVFPLGRRGPLNGLRFVGRRA